MVNTQEQAVDADLARTLMADFAKSTGVSSGRPPRRYLWTDAFAVCNFLGLYLQDGDDRYLQLALQLVEQVHHVLGRHRDDDPRSGWISSLSENEGKAHPTRGGLRIGKPFNERAPDEPLDPNLEWDRDGQYFHYLTKWMHALHRVAQETGKGRFLRWAIELAVIAHNAFTYTASAGAAKRMVWKMSIDLSRPLVPSMGHHDPLDGLITYLELQKAEKFEQVDRAELTQGIADTTSMCEGGRWVTDDPLGLGGLLGDAARLAKVIVRCGEPRQRLLRELLLDANRGLKSFMRSSDLNRSPERRLAFRELGLVIGFHGLSLVQQVLKHNAPLSPLIEEVLKFRSLAREIQTFWSDAAHRDNATWEAHGDINSVMLATCLVPQGYLSVNV